VKKVTPFPILVLKGDAQVEIQDGIIFSAPDYCVSNCSKGKCIEEYESLEFTKKLQFKECHKGFLIAYKRHHKTNFVFTGMVDVLDKAKNVKIFKKKFKANYIPRKFVSKFVSGYEITEVSFQNGVNNRVRQLIQPYHDIKRLIGTIVSNVERIALKQNPGVGLYESTKKLDDDLTTIYKTSQLIDSYTAITDSIASPKTLKSGRTRPRGVYKSFDKMTRILRSRARERKVNIKIQGRSFKEIPAYESLDLIPFILVDNAIKYSIEENDVEIIFSETEELLRIEIINIGCFISDEDHERIFKKFGRGEYASKFSAQGSGVGLYLCKIIANHHSATVKVESEKIGFETEGVEIAKNTVTLEFIEFYS